MALCEFGRMGGIVGLGPGPFSWKQSCHRQKLNLKDGVNEESESLVMPLEGI